MTKTDADTWANRFQTRAAIPVDVVRRGQDSYGVAIDVEMDGKPLYFWTVADCEEMWAEGQPTEEEKRAHAQERFERMVDERGLRDHVNKLRKGLKDLR